MQLTLYGVVCVVGQESINDYYDVLLRQTLSSSPPPSVKRTILSAFAANVVATQHLKSSNKEPKSQRDKSWYWWVPHWERWREQCVWVRACEMNMAIAVPPLPCSHRWNQSMQSPQGEERPGGCRKTQVTLMGCLSILETTGSDWLLLGKTTSTHKPTRSVRLYGSSRRSFRRRVFITRTLVNPESNKIEQNWLQCLKRKEFNKTNLDRIEKYSRSKLNRKESN